MVRADVLLRNATRRWLAVAGTFIVAAANAAVVDSTAQGFSIEEKVHIAQSPQRVYAALLEPAKWWNSQHTLSGHAANLSLDMHPGGCLCERLPEGGFVQHLTVIYAVPGKTLRLKGAMGPFQSQGVEGVLTFKLAAKDTGTDLVLDNTYGGYVRGGFGDWPASADSMLTDLIGRLKNYLETGKSDAAR